MKKGLILMIFLFSALSAHGEIIVLKNGKVNQGKIISQTSDEVIFNDSGILSAYYFDEIETITNDRSVIENYRQKQKEKTAERLEYINQLSQSFEEETTGEQLSYKERMDRISKMVEEKYGDKEEAEMENNDRLAYNLLRMLSQASENYATFNNGQYPSTISDLTEASPPFLANSLCDVTKSGFEYTCDMSVDGYTFTATPVIPGQTGSRPFFVQAKK